MEEQQIQEFVHRAVMDQAIRNEIALDPTGVIGRADLSPRVVDILIRLAPYLAFDRPLDSDEKWWHA